MIINQVMSVSRASIPADSSWQLPTGNYVTANLEPDVIFPKDDLTTNSYARHRNQPEGLQYNVKIGIKGGSYPHHYEIVSAPSGFTIGEDVGDANYGVMNWDSPTIGTHSIEISWADQDDGRNSKSWDTSGTIEFDLVVAASGSANDVYFDETDTGSLSLGTVAEPYNDWADLWGSTTSATVNAGKIVFFRAGTHNLTRFSDTSNDKISLTASNKPMAYVAYPGEAAIIDCGGLNGTAGSGGTGAVITPTVAEDIYFGGGLTFTNNFNNSTRADYINPNGGQLRLTLDNVIFDGFDDGPGVSNNPGCIVFPDGGSGDPDYDTALLRIEATGNNGNVIEMYRHDRTVIDTVDANCSFTVSDASNSAGMIYLKGTPFNCTVRNVTSVEVVTTTGRAGVGMGNSVGSGNVEVEYCNTVAENVTDEIHLNYPSSTTSYGGPFYYTRCTIFGIIDRSGGGQGGNIVETYQNCVVVNEASPVIPLNSDETGTHTGGTSSTVMTDSSATFEDDKLIGLTIENTTTGNSAVITGNTATTVTTAAITGDWSSSDAYNIVISVLVDNLTGDSADSIIDTSTGLLTGSYRTTYLGTRGHEVSA